MFLIIPWNILPGKKDRNWKQVFVSFILRYPCRLSACFLDMTYLWCIYDFSSFLIFNPWYICDIYLIIINICIHCISFVKYVWPLWPNTAIYFSIITKNNWTEQVVLVHAKRKKVCRTMWGLRRQNRRKTERIEVDASRTSREHQASHKKRSWKICRWVSYVFIINCLVLLW